MLSISADTIVTEVRLRLDEIGANDSEMIDVDKDDSELDSIIKAVIPDAYRLVMLGADESMLEGKESTETCTIDASTGIASVKVPDNFLRLVSVRMKSWYSAASDVILENSSEYRQQSDPYACATYEHPVAAIVHKVENGKSQRYIELYKPKDMTDTLSHFVYIPTHDSDSDEYDVPSQLREAVIWYVAALSLVAVRDDHSDKCLEIAKGLMGGGE